MKLWNVAPLDKAQAVKIQNEYGLESIIAMLLQIRSITEKGEVEDFLYNDSLIASPFEIKDVDKAVQRIKKAIDDFELICVYGDYDADGVTSTALLFSYLEAVGANVMYYIPSREAEGYGMNTSAIDSLHQNGVNLIVTVDNGISAVNEIEYASSLGIDTVVTDHHQPPEILPNACAVVDLHRTDCKSKFKNLSGVGVAFKLVMALEGEYCDVDALLDNYADLVCLGTIGDIVELRGENRVFVKRGLYSLMNTDRIGIDALISTSGLSGKRLTAGSVSFTIVPRINAVGRLGLSKNSVALLLSEDEDEAEEIAEQLSEDNSQRQQIEKEILIKIDEEIRKNPSLTQDRIIVIDGEGWHQGVIGIVASRIKEIFGKPTIIISKNGDESKASGRSVDGFSLCDAVFACADLLTHYGGHPMAVGLSLKSENIGAFRRKINEYAKSLGQMPYEKINIDIKLNPAGLSVPLVQSLAQLQPYGAGNPTPIIGLFNMKLERIVPLAGDKHLKLILGRGESKVEALKFSVSSAQFPYEVGDVLDLAVTLDLNEYNGRVSVSTVIKDIKPSDADSEHYLKSMRNYESLCLSESLKREQVEELLPDRNDFAIVYRYLKNKGEYNFSLETLVHRLDNKLSFGKIKVITEAMRELGLIEMSQGLYQTHIKVLPAEHKVSIESAPIIRKLRGCSFA